jgi:hypothetical protein
MTTLITPLPTPPTRQDSSNFNDRADEFLGALPLFQQEANALAVDVQSSADDVEIARQAVASVANVTKWISGTTYSEGISVWSPINGVVYRKMTSTTGGTTDPSLDSVNYKSITDSNGVIYTPAGTGAVSTDVQSKLRESVSVMDFDAVGDGTTNDTDAFTALEIDHSGKVIDLNGKTYVVDAYPAGNTYVNGSFVVSGTTYDAAQSKAVISSALDTGGLASSYSSPVTGLISPSGRNNSHTFAVVASGNSRATGPGRAGTFASIYSHARGNISATVAARQGFALSPQSFVAAVEESEILGQSRNAIIASAFSSAENFMGVSIGSRAGHTNGENNAVIASRYSSCGTGYGAKFAVTTIGGVITSVEVVSGGQDYASPTLTFADRTGAGTGAAATATTSGGVITGVTVTNGGSGYSNNSAFVGAGNYASGLAAKVDCVAYDSSSICNAVIASEGAISSSAYSSAIASFNVVASGGNSAVIAAKSVTASGLYSAAIAAGANVPGTTNVVVSGLNALVAAASDATASSGFATVISGNFNTASNTASVVIGSRRTENNIARSIAGGNSSSGVASTANRKWHILSDNGAFQSAASFTGATTFTDYAEYFENLTDGVISLGTLVALDGRKVRPTQLGDDILGVVSATALIVAGDAPFTWGGRYLTGEFGEMLYEDIPDPDWQPMIPDPAWPATIPNPAHPVIEREPAFGEDGEHAGYIEMVVSESTIPNPAPAPLIQNPAPQEVIRIPLENPDYDPAIPNVPRSKRPNEWTCVGLLGQVHVRVAADVQPGDYVAAGDGGVGSKSMTTSNMRCMEIRQPFDPAKCYAVAFCLVR